MSETWRCAWRELTRRKGRTLTSVLGYALAVGVPLTLLCLLLAAKDAASTVLKSTGTHFVAFVPACQPLCYFAGVAPSEGEGFVGSGGVLAGLLPSDVLEFVRRIPSVKCAAPFLLYRFADPAASNLFTVGGFDLADIEAVGTTSCAATDILDGRFLNATDKGSVMVEESYAMQRNLRVGDTCQVAGLPFRVVGVINPGVRPAKADVYMPIQEAVEVMARRVTSNLGKQISMVLVEVRSSTLQEQAMQAVKKLLPGGVISTYACYRPAAQVIGINEKAVWLLTLVIAAFAVAFAMKSQLASVMERRRDIGILKAIGWTDGDVTAQIVVESLLQAVAGGVTGCVGAVAFLALAPLGKWSAGPVVRLLVEQPLILPVALGLAALGGAVAGAVPAWVAASQRPAEAMRRL